MDALDVDHLNELLEQDVDVREKIKDQVSHLDKKTRIIVGILNKIHSTPTDAIPPLLDSVRPILLSCHDTSATIASLVPPNQLWRWKDMWSNSLRAAVYSAALVEYLSSGSLITLSQANELLGIKAEWGDRFSIVVEDYLHGLISLVNELVNETCQLLQFLESIELAPDSPFFQSRLAVNAVTFGDYEAPLRISAFVKDLFAGFSMLNLKNDTLRRRFDSLKYDLKKIEEVVYDVSLRKLADPTNVVRK